MGIIIGQVWASQVMLVVKNLPANLGDIRDVGSVLGLGRFSGRRAWQPTAGFLPGESHGQRTLAGYRSPGRKESATTEQAHTHLPKGCGVGVGIGTADQPPPSCLTSSKPLRPLNPGFLI